MSIILIGAILLVQYIMTLGVSGLWLWLCPEAFENEWLKGKYELGTAFIFGLVWPLSLPYLLGIVFYRKLLAVKSDIDKREAELKRELDCAKKELDDFITGRRTR